jgi:hypothetical protein
MTASESLRRATNGATIYGMTPLERDLERALLDPREMALESVANILKEREELCEPFLG